MADVSGICRKCVFWNKTGHTEHKEPFGDCHRYPPTYGTAEYYKFPEMLGTDWCGEFRIGPEINIFSRREGRYD